MSRFYDGTFDDDMEDRIEWLNNVQEFAIGDNLDDMAKLANWSKCSPSYVKHIPRGMLLALLEDKYLFHYDGEYVSVFGVKDD
jgi:hypothetical protein